MLIRPEPQCLVIADISGYTRFLAAVEIDHGQDIVADLLRTIVTALRPRFRLAELEGDAAFLHAPADGVDAAAVLDALERCYFAFRRRRRDVRQATTCECRACVRIPDLNLKFVVHTGTAIRQKVAGRENLYGPDVIVVHRLLKNHVVESLGVAAYALLTETVFAGGALQPDSLGMVRVVEEYEHLGEIGAWVHDLEQRWQEEDARRRVIVGPEDALATIEFEVPAPPQTTWEFLTEPGRRVAWRHDVTAVIETKATGGRRGVGTVNHCMHGDAALIEEILDWRPYDYVTHRTTMPGGAPTFDSTFELEPTATGTIIHYRFAPPRSVKERAMLEAALGEFEHGFSLDIASLTAQLGDASDQSAREGVSEPALPAPRPSAPFAN